MTFSVTAPGDISMPRLAAKSSAHREEGEDPLRCAPPETIYVTLG